VARPGQAEARGACGRRRLVHDRGGADAGARGRIGKRQVHRRAHVAATHGAHGRRRAVRGPRRVHAAPARPSRPAPPHADRVPGSLQLPQPAHDGAPDPARTARDPSPRRRSRRGPPRGRPARRSGARRGPRRQLSARAVGRAAPARRDRARAVGGAGVHRVRRARLRPRRVGAGAGPEPPQRPAAPPPAHLPFHRARSRRGPPHRGTGGGDVPREDRRAGAGRGRVPAATAPVHAIAALGGPGPRSQRAAAAHHPHR